MVVRCTSYESTITRKDINNSDLKTLLSTIERDSSGGINYIDKTTISEREYQYSSGTPINKWFPYFWNHPPNMNIKDETYIILWERYDHEMTVKSIEKINKRLWDSRIVNLYTKKNNERDREFIIMGNCTKDSYSLNSSKSCVFHNSSQMREKICSLKCKFDSHKKNNIILSDELKIIAPCLTQADKAEKNYSLIHIQYDDSKRIWSETAKKKGFLVHFHMTRKGTGGNIFFWAPRTESSNTDDVLNNRTNWETIEPRNSDFFLKYNTWFNNGVNGQSSRISCTTPLLQIDSFRDEGKKFIAVGHFKINWVAYLDNLIRSAGSEMDSSVQTNPFYKFYKNEMAPRLKSKIQLQKYQLLIRKGLGSSYGLNFMDDAKYPHFFTMALADGWIIDGDTLPQTSYHGFYGTVNCLHTHYIYFQFFYGLNYKSLELDFMSDYFLIGHEDPNDDRGASFLNFPVGLTTNDDNYWISYGDGDCKSLIASWKKEKLNDLCRHQNPSSLKMEDIEFKYFT